jgi:hypothetical protein
VFLQTILEWLPKPIVFEITSILTYFSMKKNITYLLAFLMVIGISDAVMAQAHKNCGMKVEDLAEVKRQMLENRREMANFTSTRNDVVTYVPIRWHLVANAAGEGRAGERQALDALCNLNTNYEEQEVQFYIEEFNYINSNTIYSNPDGFSGAINLSANMTYDAVNIFVVGPEVGVDPSNPGSVVQAYYQPPAGASGGRDWIVCNKLYLTDEYVLTHEMGHFLSLPHPFSGWDFTPWDSDVHGNPVMLNNAPDGGQVERVNGSNCSTAGDAICDTPADYNFGLTFNSNCNYTGNCRDANDELLTPLEENVMNYFGCNTQSFTAGQEVEVQNSLNSNNRNYCTPDYTPEIGEITGNLDLIYPNNLQTTNNYNYVNLQWEAKDNATSYVVEIAGAQVFIMVTNSNNLELTNLEAGSTYLWKVTPFNESGGCANTSSQQIFKTGDNATATTDVKEISDWTIAPNPVSNQENIRVSINASANFTADLFLVDLTGKIVQMINNQVFTAGNAVVEMRVADLPTGIYTLAVQSANGVSNQRIVVTK